MAAKNVRKKSLKKQIARGFLFPLILLIGFLIYYNIYSVNLYNQEINQSNSAMISLYMNNLESYLSEMDNFMFHTVVNNSNFNLLRYELTQLQAYLAIEGVSDACETQLSRGTMVGGIYLYSIQNNIYRHVHVEEYAYTKKENLHSWLKIILDTDQNYIDRGWFYEKIGETDYLFRIFNSHDAYIVSFIELNDIVLPLDYLSESEYQVVFRKTGGTIITNETLVNDNNLSFEGTTAYGKMVNVNVDGNRKYTITGNRIQGTDIEMYLVKSNKGFLGELRVTQVILFIISVLSILTIPYGIYSIRRSVTKPIDQLKSAMEQIKKGEMDTQIDAEYELVEFGEINDTFNSMISKIKVLKIQSYEEMLGRQKAHLQYLQLQLEPHFFLNCLKTIYAMAQNHKFEKVQKLVLIVSNYLRYMFRDNSTMVTLEEELNYVKNYLQIQEMASDMPPVCIMDVDMNLLSKRIPPLVIQTFIENSVKYASLAGKQLRVSIRISRLQTDETDYFDIIIKDNGMGYPSDVLKLLDGQEQDNQEGKHIGIQNVKQRLSLLFGDKAEFVFQNTETGAYSELIIPVTKFGLEEEL